MKWKQTIDTNNLVSWESNNHIISVENKRVETNTGKNLMWTVNHKLRIYTDNDMIFATPFRHRAIQSAKKLMKLISKIEDE